MNNFSANLEFDEDKLPIQRSLSTALGVYGFRAVILITVAFINFFLWLIVLAFYKSSELTGIFIASMVLSLVLVTVWLIMKRGSEKTKRKINSLLKRAFDLFLVFFSLPLMIIFALIIGVAIKLDSRGPIIFRSLRYGLDGRPFKIYKFRTMVASTNELKSNLAPLNRLSYPDHKPTEDPRITRVGRILRKTSLDELPQILNIIKGEMSLIGPRPESIIHSEISKTAPFWHFDVKPGITGLWQITKGANYEEKVKLDIQYIEDWSLWLDLEIILRTIYVVQNPDYKASRRFLEKLDKLIVTHEPG